MHFTLTDLAADITQNSAESGARQLVLEIRETAAAGSPEEPAKNEFRFIIGDNGKGMNTAELERAVDPFVTDGVKHPGRKVGLGIPFLVQTALQSGGGWNITSAKAEGHVTIPELADGKTGSKQGTTVEAWFDLSNVDTPPVGDIPGLFRTALLFAGLEEVILKRSRKNSALGNLDYEVRKTELIEALGDLEDAASLVLLGKYLRSLEGNDE